MRRLAATLASRKAEGELPTTTLYFTEPVTPLLSELGLGPIERLAPNIYRLGETIVISRYASGEDLTLVRAVKPRRLCYIVDDDIEAACSDEALPVGYRERLSEFYHARHQSIVSASTDILISNPVLRALSRACAPGQSSCHRTGLAKGFVRAPETA